MPSSAPSPEPPPSASAAAASAARAARSSPRWCSTALKSSAHTSLPRSTSSSETTPSLKDEWKASRNCSRPRARRRRRAPRHAPRRRSRPARAESGQRGASTSDAHRRPPPHPTRRGDWCPQALLRQFHRQQHRDAPGAAHSAPSAHPPSGRWRGVRRGSFSWRRRSWACQNRSSRAIVAASRRRRRKPDRARDGLNTREVRYTVPLAAAPLRCLQP